MIPSRVEPSLTLALLETVRTLRAQGVDLASFAAGEPDFPTPPVVVAEAIRSMQAGNTRYVATPGIPELREAIARDYRERLRAKWVKAENVLVSAGAKQGIYLSLCGILNPGDEVLIPAPYWVSYPHIVEVAGGVGRIVQCLEEHDFFPTVAQLDAAYTPRTKALIFSSPCNPTGAMISREALKAIVDWCEHRKVTLLYDEIYERLALDTEAHVSPLALVTEAQSEYVLSINAFSKSLAMTGWRLGYIVSHAGNIEALSPLHGQMLTSLPGFIQSAAAVGLKDATELLEPIIKTYRRRRDAMLDAFALMPKVRAMKPMGAFYVCADVREIMKAKGIADDSRFAELLLEQAHVVVLPGSSMGLPGWLRFSFATGDDEIAKGLARFGRFCAL